ncbi:hypothetical protein NM208_g1486 [Fusarium decemcellulare]|uniref:Uncharacterized protein n=1 Tax=Fusarium decemcellulare TaxID=57161 RepID=A0ACC1SVS7_9HYPO|nr:hypothetical protein NM208_g1486 [Fusarium decemcellulare]
MAAGGIEAVSLVLAIPGLIDLAFKYGEWIVDRIETFQTAKGVWAELKQFGVGLTKGELRNTILTAKSFYLEEGCDPGLKNSLELQIRRLAVNVETVRIFLETQNPDHLFDRIIFTISGERRAKALIKDLKLDVRELTQTLTIGDLYARRVPNAVLLTHKRFSDYQSFPQKPLSFSTNLLIAKGDYCDDALQESYREATVILERFPAKEEVSEDLIKDIATYLHNRLPSKVSDGKQDVLLKGILPCLGYRMTPHVEFVFEMPQNLHNPQTLQTLIVADQGVLRHPLDFRLRLARRLAEAVLRVHAAGLVHKNIRTETVVVLQPVQPPQDEATRNAVGFGEVYLTNWRLLRDAMGPSILSGGTHWTEDIYRHPKRQGLQIEDKYNMGHDIYSLGVCLLEIGLWDPLVHMQTADGQPRVSNLFREAAKVDLSPNPEDELKIKLKKPTEVKEILLQLAHDYLPSRMGLGYHRLTVSCLTGLDKPSGFGDGVDFTKMNQAEQGVAFKELVLSFITEIAI